MITLKNIADECQVSTSTVSLVLNRPQKISKEVRDKVYETVIRYGYIKDKSVAFKQIGLVINRFDTDFFGDFYGDVIYGLLNKSSLMNLNIRILRDFDVDYYDVHDLQGIIFVGKTPSEFLAKAKKFKIPFICSGHPNYEHPDVPTVYLSRITNTHNLVKVILNNGHTEIAIMLGESDERDIIRKEFIDTIQTHNPYFRPDLVYVADYDDIQTVEVAWCDIISKAPKVTAIMCANDLLAYYCYRCADKYDINIPKQMTITGFDGINFPRHVIQPTPELTTVRGDRIKLGIKSIEMLQSVIQGQKLAETLNQMTGSLFLGNSVGRV